MTRVLRFISASAEISKGVKKATDILQQIALEGLREELDRMLPLVLRVMRQTRARILHGDTHVEDKVLSVFEPSTEIIRKDKAGKPNEFGKMIKLQDCRLNLCPAAQWRSVDPGHRNPPGGVPGLVATDAGFYSARNEAAARALGSRGYAFPIDRAKALSASANRRSGGSAMARNGARDVQNASAWSSGETVSIDTDTRVTPECSAGSPSV